jgi:hypothetical protein
VLLRRLPSAGQTRRAVTRPATTAYTAIYLFHMRRYTRMRQGVSGQWLLNAHIAAC